MRRASCARTLLTRSFPASRKRLRDGKAVVGMGGRALNFTRSRLNNNNRPLPPHFRLRKRIRDGRAVGVMVGVGAAAR